MRVILASILMLVLIAAAAARADPPVNFEAPEASLLEPPEGADGSVSPLAEPIELDAAQLAGRTGQTFHGTLARGRKAYYRLRVGSAAETFRMAATLRGGYAALLERAGHYPTLSHNDHHNYTRAAQVTLDFTGAAHSTHIMALYAWSDLRYTLTISTVDGCSAAQRCNNHGTCKLVSGHPVCECIPGYAGPACRVPVYPLSFLQWKTMAVSKPLMFRLPYSYVNRPFAIWVNMSTPHRSGAKVVVSKHYDVFNPSAVVERNMTGRPHVHVRVEEATRDTYYIYVEPCEAGHLSLVAEHEALAHCPSYCSGLSHGACVGHGSGRHLESHCQCRPGYTGEACNVATGKLVGNARVAGVSQDQTYNWYTYQSADDVAGITMQLTDVSGGRSCALYAAYGSAHATRYHYSRARRGAAKLLVAFDQPNAALFSIGVSGNGVCNYTLEVSTKAVCRFGQMCHNGGKCLSDGSCECPASYGGPQCTVPVHAISGSGVVSGAVAPLAWQYYLVNTTSTLLSVHVRSVPAASAPASPGSLYLFVRRGSVPTLLSYDAEDKDSASVQHAVTLETGLTNGDHGAFYVGVYGTPFMRARPTTAFHLQAWASPVSGRPGAAKEAVELVPIEQ